MATVWDLVITLAGERAQSTPGRWKTFCESLTNHWIVGLLLEDPYTRDARSKPAGYAGDARTLDYVYLRDSNTNGISDFGRTLFQITTSVPVADAVRGRSRSLANAIERQASDHESITLSSIACGHLRELDHVSSNIMHRSSVWALDQDALSIASCSARFSDRNVCTQLGSVRELIVGRIRIPNSDLIYASGLFDYLDDRAAGVLIKRMVASLRPGGTLLVPNLTPHNEEIAYMEAIMDWWMQYRTVDDMWRIADQTHLDPATFQTMAFSSDGGRVGWLRVQRTS